MVTEEIVCLLIGKMVPSGFQFPTTSAPKVTTPRSGTVSSQRCATELCSSCWSFGHQSNESLLTEWFHGMLPLHLFRIQRWMMCACNNGLMTISSVCWMWSWVARWSSSHDTWIIHDNGANNHFIAGLDSVVSGIDKWDDIFSRMAIDAGLANLWMIFCKLSLRLLWLLSLNAHFRLHHWMITWKNVAKNLMKWNCAKMIE